ncbi:hypothetical protein B0H17DRAFT_1331410 [Mycena rosella]|uniref:Uncharacterized protein n=1 Tax=Mycena rosella TaxID=1033263 RepID=A0AAD7DG33_MYCRO|nr:hypothetical protein B0H17DRAFT_1331410 [Mycena rosella]
MRLAFEMVLNGGELPVTNAENGHFVTQSRGDFLFFPNDDLEKAHLRPDIAIQTTERPKGKPLPHMTAPFPRLKCATNTIQDPQCASRIHGNVHRIRPWLTRWPSSTSHFERDVAPYMARQNSSAIPALLASAQRRRPADDELVRGGVSPRPVRDHRTAIQRAPLQARPRPPVAEDYGQRTPAATR